MDKKIRLSLIISLLFISTYAQDLIKSGPMVGYSTMQEVLLWVQTDEKAKVHFEYYEIDNPKIKLDMTTARNNNNVFANKLVTFQD